jgi:hypothetical protein
MDVTGSREIAAGVEPAHLEGQSPDVIQSTLRCWLNLGAIGSSPRFWLKEPLIGAHVSAATTAPHIQRTLYRIGFINERRTNRAEEL